MNQPGHSLRDTLQSQMNRANELFSELETEVKKDISNSCVSMRTSEITEDILTKLSNCLDKGINQYQQLRQQPINTSLYFPITQREDSFKQKLASIKLGDLEKTDPKLYALLHESQPFVSKENEILLELHKRGSREKHRILSLQRKEVVDLRTSISHNSSGNAVSWSKSAVTFGPGIAILGVPVNPATQLPDRVPPTHTVKVQSFISIKFQDKDIDVLQFCRYSIDKVKKIVDQIILLSDKT